MKPEEILNEETLMTLSPQIKKTIYLPSILLSAVILLAGTGLFLLSMLIDDKSSSSYMSATTLGAVAILLALYRFTFSSRQLVYQPTGSKIVKDSLHFDSAKINRVRQALDNRDIDSLSTLELKSSANARMDVMKSKDGNLVAVKLYEYIPYTYEPASDIYLLTGEEAQPLACYLTNAVK